MSSFPTHMLIGAVGGLGLIQVIDRFAPGFVSGILPDQPRIYAEALIIAVSAISSTVPDIDTPGSWLSQRIQIAALLIGIIVGGIIGLQMSQRYAADLGLNGSVVLILCIIAGGFLGWLLGRMFPRTVRAGAGGHRAGTHSVFFPSIMLIAAATLQIAGLPAFVPLPIILAWGWALHIPGDIVTPNGWKPFSPVSNFTLRLPRSIARYGEKLIIIAAVAVGWMLLRVS